MPRSRNSSNKDTNETKQTNEPEEGEVTSNFTNYTFTGLLNVIEIASKYKLSKKRPRKEQNYNPDMENLSHALVPLRKLNSLIGMDSIKNAILDQILFYAQNLNTDEMIHTCLTGPPGVGKTTLGKIIAELYCSMGFLKTNNFRVVGRADLVAGYLGQTAIKTKKVLNESLGGVLFIDEAYSLGGGGDDDTGSSYSKECIDTINQFLSENTKDFILIIAGYKEELNKYFFSVNKGLERRFPWRYDINEYTDNNLMDIFKYQVQQGKWRLNECAITGLGELFKKYKPKGIFSNNGGDTLLLFDKSKIIHSRRVFGLEYYRKKILTLEDLTKAADLMVIFKEIKKQKENKPPEGMYL